MGMFIFIVEPYVVLTWGFVQ